MMVCLGGIFVEYFKISAKIEFEISKFYKKSFELKKKLCGQQ
jgi:hypothetical protein